jgi:hypothetical protein
MPPPAPRLFPSTAVSLTIPLLSRIPRPGDSTDGADGHPAPHRDARFPTAVVVAVPARCMATGGAGPACTPKHPAARPLAFGGRTKELKPSLSRMLRTWLSTVCSEMSRRIPICLLLSPPATSRATSLSRLPSGDGTAAAEPLAGPVLGLERRHGQLHGRAHQRRDVGQEPTADAGLQPRRRVRSRRRGPADQRGAAEVHQHHLEAGAVARGAAAPRPFRRGRPGGADVARERAAERTPPPPAVSPTPGESAPSAAPSSASASPVPAPGSAPRRSGHVSHWLVPMLATPARTTSPPSPTSSKPGPSPPSSTAHLRSARRQSRSPTRTRPRQGKAVTI